MKKIDFNKLVEGAQQLNTGIDQGFYIQRNVEQINESAQRLASKSVASSTDFTRNKAYALLAQKGVDPDKLTRNLQAIDLKTGLGGNDGGEPLSETDIESYLQFEYDTAIIAAIEEAKKETLTQYRKSYDELLNSDWENSKRELLESMGQRSSLAAVTTGRGRATNFVSIMQSGPQIPKHATKLDEKMMQYSQVVGKINETRLLGSAGKIPVMTMFGDVAQRIAERIPDPRSGELSDAWSLLRYMMREHEKVIPAESSYSNRNSASANFRMERAFMNGALDFLQKQYLWMMELNIKQKPEKAMRGGEPSVKTTIRGYLNVLLDDRQITNLELLPSGEAIWPMLYYCIRCGNFNEALAIAKPAGNALGSFTTYLEAYINSPEHILPSSMWAQICTEFNSTVKRSKDMYKVLVWNIIGRCEIHDWTPFNKIIVSAQDFIWYKLILTRPSNEPLPDQLLSQDLQLHHIQAQILDLGPAHFNPHQDTPLLYLFVLLTLQLFEEAIHFLYTGTDNSRYQVDAVHMAVGLYYYDAVRLPPIQDSIAKLPPPSLTDVVPVELLVSSTPTQFNFYRLIHDYVLRISAPAEAMQYLCLFRNVWLRALAIKDLVISSQDYDILLGHPMPDGSIRAGLVQKMLLKEQAVETIRLVGESAKESGRYDEAMRLFELAGDLESVIKLVSNRLSTVLSSHNPDRDHLFNTASQIYQRVKASPRANISRSLFVEFDQLLSLGTFFTLFHQGKFEEAILLMSQTHILPFEHKDIPLCVDNFKRWPQTLTRILPDLLLAVMIVLTNLYEATKMSQQVITVGSNYDGGREARMIKLREMAHTLITFSGMVPHRMPGDVNARLLSMEVAMK